MGVKGVLRSATTRLRDARHSVDRRDEYSGLLGAAQRGGYELVSLQGFHVRATKAEIPNWRVLALRHDVDISDVEGNEAFYEVERAIGARSTFYFRESTSGVHRDFMRRLLRDGFEVGYHYEEGATVAKRHGLTSRAAVEERRGEIVALFRRNCAEFRGRWNPGLSSVASHGDWANRRLEFANHEFVTPGLLAECGLRFEAYADDFLGRFDVYVSDVALFPQRWAAGYGIEEAIRDGHQRICLLTHERRWHVSRRAGLTADVTRAADGVRFEWNRRRLAGSRRPRVENSPGGPPG